MSIRLTQAEIQWIKQEYEAGNTVQDIVFDTGMSVSNIKRALAEAGVLTLHWYKTNEENAMLEYLKQNNVTTLQELKLWV